MKLLKKLYEIHSPSHHEQRMSAYVQNVLKRHRIDFEVDPNGQVFKLIPGRPILSCHMDQVQDGPPGRVIVDGDIIRGERDGLGADDKNGIWICLNLLTKWDCSFIFSTGEEDISKEVENVLDANHEVLGRIPYALVFDRRGSGDIIGSDNDYCSLEFEQVVAREGRAFGYRPTSGVFSDADSLCWHMETVNLSVGYYQAHSQIEFTRFSKLVNALKFGDHLLGSI